MMIITKKTVKKLMIDKIKSTYVGSGDDDISTFSYDSKGNLISVSNEKKGETVCLYNDQGHIQFIKTKANLGDRNIEYEYEFKYNFLNPFNFEVFMCFKSDGKISYEDTLVIENDKIISMHESPYDYYSYSKTFFEYDQKGNVLQIKEINHIINSGVKEMDIFSYKYDDKKNVFANMSLPKWVFYFMSFNAGDSDNYSAGGGVNNPVSCTEKISRKNNDRSHTKTYKYDYNADGFPTIRYMSDDGGPMKTNKEYTYKEYTFEIDE